MHWFEVLSDQSKVFVYILFWGTLLSGFVLDCICGERRRGQYRYDSKGKYCYNYPWGKFKVWHNYHIIHWAFWFPMTLFNIAGMIICALVVLAGCFGAGFLIYQLIIWLWSSIIEVGCSIGKDFF